MKIGVFIARFFVILAKDPFATAAKRHPPRPNGVCRGGALSPPAWLAHKKGESTETLPYGADLDCDGYFSLTNSSNVFRFFSLGVSAGYPTVTTSRTGRLSPQISRILPSSSQPRMQVPNP